MKTILFCFLFIASCSFCQTNNLAAYGIYTTASDFTSKNITDGFDTKDATHKLQDKVTHKVSVENNGVTNTYAYDSIWGFRRDGSDWRVYNYRIYKVAYNGKACVYTRPTKTDMSVPGLTRFETTFFSATPESPVYPLTQENLLLVFKNNPSLVNKISSLHQSYPVTKMDKSTGTYEFLNWL